jgi:type VI secretion system protein ImpA
MPQLADLLAPIPGPTPAGPDLRYDPVYTKLKEARREDPDAPQGDWQYTRKTADWTQTATLASDVLAKRSKDLQVAVWLAEALLRRDGFAGFRQSLDLLSDLLDRFWDDLHPELENGDAEARVALLDWVGERLDLAVRQVPLNRDGHTLLRYTESRVVGYEAAAAEDPARQAARERAIAAGKLSAEEFDLASDGTPTETYRQLVTDLGGCLQALERLDQVGRSKFRDAAPNYSKLRDALEEAQRVCRQILKKRVGADPEPEPAQPSVPGNGADQTVPRVLEPTANGALIAPPGSPEEAVARLGAAAGVLRRAQPNDPAAYLLLRGFRWGELRGTRGPDPRLLEAPATAVRTGLKSLLLERRWEELLEAAERVMETPQGRGWLDLQRYTVTACESLGPTFRPVAAAIKGELRSLLAEIPDLPEMTLMDDTPTANTETRTWLRESVVEPVNGRNPGDEEPSRSAGGPRSIEELVRALERETSRRGRFLRQTELAGVMVEAGIEPVAKPILEDLLAQIDAHKLEDWESGDLVARPLALLYRCLDKLGTDAALKETLYLRVCRLDPLQALEFTRD